MLDRSDALALVLGKLTGMAPVGDEWVVLDEKTVEKSYGWIFFYNSRKFVETGQIIHRLAGNGPVIVNKFDESIEFYGSNPSVDIILEGYERKLKEQE
jgi:Immunity protein 35